MVNKHALEGFTLIEVFITFTILIVLLSIINLSNILTYIQKTHDVETKNDLKKSRVILESFHKDNGRYPTVTELTYDLQDDTTLAGKLCGSSYTDDLLKEYVSELPCSAQSPTADYVYFTFNNNQDFVIFTKLERSDDPAIQDSGCSAGCSYYTDIDNPINSLSAHYFNYAVYSSFDFMQCPLDNQWYCQRNGGSNLCNTCAGRTSGPCFDPTEKKYCHTSWCQVECI